MGWGTELWDRLEAIESQSAEGIAFISHVRTLAAKVMKRDVAWPCCCLAAWLLDCCCCCCGVWHRHLNQESK